MLLRVKLDGTEMTDLPPSFKAVFQVNEIMICIRVTEGDEGGCLLHRFAYQNHPPHLIYFYEIWKEKRQASGQFQSGMLDHLLVWFMPFLLDMITEHSPNP